MTSPPALHRRLTDIFFAHQGNLSDKWEQYLGIYEAELQRFIAAERPVRLLEIGVQNGGSLQIWSKYLPAGSTILGIDIDPACAALKLGESIEVRIGDASDSNTVHSLIGKTPFDVVIDDGSHRSDHVISTFGACFPNLKPGGLYIVEDVHCSYFSSYGGGFRKPASAMEFFKKLADAVNTDYFESDAERSEGDEAIAYLRTMNSDVARITFYDSVVVVEKLLLAKASPYRRVMTGAQAPVSDPAGAISGQSPSQLGQLMLSDSAVGAFNAAMRNALASARETSRAMKKAQDEAVSRLNEVEAELRNERDQREVMARELNFALASVGEEIDRRRETEAARASISIELEAQRLELHSIRTELNNLRHSTSWRVTSPMRVIATQSMRGTRKGKNILRVKRAVGGWLPLAKIAVRTWRDLGWKALIAKTVLYSRESAPINAGDILPQRLQAMLAIIQERFEAGTSIGQEVTGPTISLLMPVYKTPIDLLNIAVQSVRQQTYPHWELCIVDDASGDLDLTQALARFTTLDRRIKVGACESNSGISITTNRAMELASGEYIALLDHDDIITRDALAEVAAAISANPATDILYSDECKVAPDGTVLEIFSKPDWSPLLLMSSMYIGHLTVYRRSLADTLGGFRSEFDFSQDYDFALRATELTHRVVHIRQVLYGWRMIPESGAAGGKPYARESNIKALQSAAKRRNWNAIAQPLPAANYLQWNAESDTPLVSIVVPSDNADNIRATIASLSQNTRYANWEIVVVTNSSIVDQMSDRGNLLNVRFIRYDKTFNFSDKCNIGATAANGLYVVFFNDDVRVVTPAWIQRLVEILRLEGVGAVAPKLVYENGTIQHAGMVTGVRRLVGTAFHCRDENTTEHYGLAQSIREVSLLSGACLSMSKKLFHEIGGFDATNTPIAHSDVDLCFRIRELGLSCVYTPYATLLHIGHASIGEVEEHERRQNRPVAKDKSDIFLLRRWPLRIADDPYFAKPMRDQIYHDSPDAFEIFPSAMRTPVGGKDILLLAHDLSRSGAPRLLVEMALFLRQCGHFVVVISPNDGAYREFLVDNGISVICDELALEGSTPMFDLAKNFDIVIGNTVLTWKDIHRVAFHAETYIYSHESQVVADQFLTIPGFTEAIGAAKGVWSAGERAARFLRPVRHDIKILPGYGADLPPSNERVRERPGNGNIVISLIGSFESRKGQDVAIKAFRRLSPARRSNLTLRLFGRVHHAAFLRQLRMDANDLPGVEIGPELPHDEYMSALKRSDIVLSAARDDTLPLVSLDALSLGRVLVCTRETGVSDFLEDGQSGFIATSATPADVSDALERALNKVEDWEVIGQRGSDLYSQHFTKQRFHSRLLSNLGLREEMSGHETPGH